MKGGKRGKGRGGLHSLCLIFCLLNVIPLCAHQPQKTFVALKSSCKDFIHIHRIGNDVVAPVQAFDYCTTGSDTDCLGSILCSHTATSAFAWKTTPLSSRRAVVRISFTDTESAMMLSLRSKLLNFTRLDQIRIAWAASFAAIPQRMTLLGRQHLCRHAAALQKFLRKRWHVTYSISSARMLCCGHAILS